MSTLSAITRLSARRSFRPLRVLGTTSSFSTSSFVGSDASTPKPKPTSSVPAGTTLAGLSILKDKPDPVALPDEQYPSWLWSLAKNAETPTDGARVEKEGGGKRMEDLGLEKKRLKNLNRNKIKAANYLRSTT